MKKFLVFIIVIFGITLLFSLNNYAQGNNEKAKTDSVVHSTIKVDDLKTKKADTKLQAWNAVCPVLGEEINPDANKVEYASKIYGFCCNGCDSKFVENPEKYSKNLSDDGKTFIEKK